MTIFDFSNYREYIKIKIEELRRSESGFSYRKFSADAGFKSPNFLKLIVDGKRNLSREGSQKVCLGLGLNTKDSEYFELLVVANQSKNIAERYSVTDQLLRLKAKQVGKTGTAVDYNYYKYWYNIPVREMLSIDLNHSKVSKLAACFVPPLDVDDLKASYQTLAQLGMIKKDEEGQWRPVESTVKTNDFFTNSMILNFHYKMLDLAKESLVQFRGNEREVSAVTVALSKKSFDRVREMLKDFKAEVLKLSEQDQAKEDVFQVNVQMFPLTKGLKSEK